MALKIVSSQCIYPSLAITRSAQQRWIIFATNRGFTIYSVYGWRQLSYDCIIVITHALALLQFLGTQQHRMQFISFYSGTAFVTISLFKVSCLFLGNTTGFMFGGKWMESSVREPHSLPSPIRARSPAATSPSLRNKSPR